MKYEKGDIVKVIKIKKRVRWRNPERSELYFIGKIGVVEYIGKSRDQFQLLLEKINANYAIHKSLQFYKHLYIIKFYFGENDSKGIIKEFFRDDELGKPSKKEMKKFQLLLEKINAKEVAEQL
jgi:hypothetical protein